MEEIMAANTTKLEEYGYSEADAPEMIRKLLTGEYVSVPCKLVSIPIADAMKDEFLSKHLEDVQKDAGANVVIYNTTNTRNPFLVTLGIDVFDGSKCLKHVDAEEIPYNLQLCVMDTLKFIGRDRILYEDEIGIFNSLTGIPKEELSQILEGVSIQEDASNYFPDVPGIEGTFSSILEKERARERSVYGRNISEIDANEFDISLDDVPLFIEQFQYDCLDLNDSVIECQILEQEELDLF